MLRGSTVNVDIFAQVDLAFVGIFEPSNFLALGIDSIIPMIFCIFPLTSYFHVSTALHETRENMYHVKMSTFTVLHFKILNCYLSEKIVISEGDVIFSARVVIRTSLLTIGEPLYKLIS